MLPVDQGQRSLHLLDGFRRAGRERLLDHRLFGAARAAKGSLQLTVVLHTAVDLHQPGGSCQQTDKGVEQFLKWRVFHGFLWDLDQLADGCQQVQLQQLDLHRGQVRAPGKMWREVHGRFNHEDGSSLARLFFCKSYRPSSCSW